MRGKMITSLLVMAIFPVLAAAAPAFGQTPLPPDESLRQSDPVTGYGVLTGGELKSPLIQISAAPPSWGGSLRLCVEIQETGISFTGDATAKSLFSAGGGDVKMTVPLPKKTRKVGYHWNAWWESGQKSVSSKVSFPVLNTNPETAADFWIPESTKTIYEINFDRGEAPHWWLESRRPEMSPVRWDIDGHPLSVPGKPYHSPYHSLNFNADSTGTYNLPGNVVRGWADSPVITISGSSNPYLSFYCNYDTDTEGKKTDQRWVRVYNNGFILVHVEQLYTTGGTCAEMGKWHRHLIPLKKEWDAIWVQFFFHSVDTIDNAHAGWFIDDFRVFGNLPPVLAAGTLQQYNSKGFVVPVGGKVTDRIDIKAVLTDPDEDPLQLEVEVRPLNGKFLGRATHVSGHIPSGHTAVVSLTGIKEGTYHYQARAKDSDGGYSKWVSFGNNHETDPDFVFSNGIKHKDPGGKDDGDKNRVSLCGASVAQGGKTTAGLMIGLLLVTLLSLLSRSRTEA